MDSPLSEAANVLVLVYCREAPDDDTTAAVPRTGEGAGLICVPPAAVSQAGLWATTTE